MTVKQKPIAPQGRSFYENEDPNKSKISLFKKIKNLLLKFHLRLIEGR